MEKDPEVYLDNPTMYAGDPGGGLMWMRDHLSPQKMITSWTAQEKDCENATKNINRLRLRLIKPTTVRPTDLPTDQSRARLPGRLDKQLYSEAEDNWKPLRKLVHNCLADLINNCLVKPRTIENGYANDRSRKQTKSKTTDQVTGQIIDREWSNNQRPSVVGLQQSERLIWEWSDCDKASDLSESGRIATDLTKEQLTEHKNACEHR